MNSFEQNPYTSSLHKHPYQMCVRCVMDTSDPDIVFDDEGVCNHCKLYPQYVANIGGQSARQRELDAIVQTLKNAGRGKDYDCIMGLSGGVDSSYLAYYAVKVLGLRPLVVHVDSGWNSELAVGNIENICKILGIDLHTLVIDWEEMRDLQLAYFRAGVANLDVPQDHAFNAAMVGEAKKYGIKHVLNGGNMQTESILPTAWGYDASDPANLRAIHKKYGTVKLKTYPIRSDLSRLLIDPYLRGMKVHRPLEYIEYNKADAKKLLADELGWRDYGGKHYESRFTKFFQAHYLPTKFGYDKRKAHLASLVASGQMTREQALTELQEPLYDPAELQEDRAYFCKKLGISRDEYDRIMQEPPRSYADYANRAGTYAAIRSAMGKVSALRKRLMPGRRRLELDA
jgi:N-acetyl sugar amidotransferase